MARESDMLRRDSATAGSAMLRKEGDSRVSLRKDVGGGAKTGAVHLDRTTSSELAASGGKAMRPRDKQALKSAAKRAGAAFGTAQAVMSEAAGAAGEEDGKAMRYASWFAKRRARKAGSKSARLRRGEVGKGMSREELARRAHRRDVRAQTWKAAGRLAGGASAGLAMAGGGADAEEDALDLAGQGAQSGLRSANRAREARARKSAYRRAKSRRTLAVKASRKAAEGRAAQAAGGAGARAVEWARGLGAQVGAALPSLAPFAIVPLLVMLGVTLAFTAGEAMDGGEYDLSKLTPNERTVASYLLNKGVPLKQTAAIMGNMFAESGMNPSAVNSDSGATGLCQWLGGRKDGLVSYAAATGRSSLAVAPQLDYLWAEATGNEATGVEMSYASLQWGYWNDDSQDFRNEHGYGAENSWEEFLEVKDVKTACRYWYAAFERGRPYEERVDDRCGKAQEYYAKMHKRGKGGDSAGMGQGAVDEAYAHLGAPYVRAAWGPDSFDCSGLVLWCYTQQGYEFSGRLDTDGLYAICTEISEEDLEVGDLVFMNHFLDNHIWGHVGMYAGDGMVIHTANEANGVCVEPLHGSWLDDCGLAFGRL